MRALIQLVYVCVCLCLCVCVCVCLCVYVCAHMCVCVCECVGREEVLFSPENFDSVTFCHCLLKQTVRLQLLCSSDCMQREATGQH